jgi:hypothetical protein
VRLALHVFRQTRNLSGLQVGKIGNEDIHGLAQGFKEVCLPEQDPVLHGVPASIEVGDRQCLATDVGGIYDGVGTIASDGDGDGTAARAYIGDRRPWGSRRANVQDLLDQELRLLPGYQDAWVDQEGQGVKLPVSHDVCEWLAPKPAFYEPTYPRALGGGHRLLQRGEEVRPLHAQNVAHQHLGFKPGIDYIAC